MDSTNDERRRNPLDLGSSGYPDDRHDYAVRLVSDMSTYHRKLAETTLSTIQERIANEETSTKNIAEYVAALRALLARRDDEWSEEDIYAIWKTL